MATERLTSFDASTAARRYADLLSRIPHVDMVVLEEIPWDGRRLWAVLDAPPFEPEYRTPVYEAQGEIIDQLDEAVFDFRVVNVRELNEPLGSVVPKDGYVLYQRPRQR